MARLSSSQVAGSIRSGTMPRSRQISRRMALIGRSWSSATISANISSSGEGSRSREATPAGQPGGMVHPVARGRRGLEPRRGPFPPAFVCSAAQARKGRGGRGATLLLSVAWRAVAREQTADDGDGDQGGIGGAEDARDEAIPGDIVGVALL